MSKTRKPRHVFAGTTRQTRLRIDEGLIPHPSERGLRLRDRSGQRLRDVIDPSTGFCLGVSGPMESDGTRTRMANPISGTGEALPIRDPRNGAWYAANGSHAVRTTVDPEGPLSRSPRQKIDASAKDDRPIRSRKPDSARRQHHRTNRITDVEIAAYLKTTFGFVPPLTSRIREAARASIVKAATVAEYAADMKRPGQVSKVGQKGK